MALKGMKKDLRKTMEERTAGGLGGLAVSEGKNAAKEISKTLDIDVRLIAFHENNDYRSFECDDASIEQLAAAIDQNGFLGSLVVAERAGGLDLNGNPAVGTQYVLLSGERRLRAVLYLRGLSTDNAIRFATLPCVVKSEFSREKTIRDAQEMVILDEANLQTRGGLMGLGDHQFITRVTNRYIENLMLAYGMSRQEAMKRLNENTNGTNLKTIYRNMQLKSGLIPPLYEISISPDYAEIPKLSMIAFTGFTEQEQQLLADGFFAAAKAAPDAAARSTALKTLAHKARALVEDYVPRAEKEAEQKQLAERAAALKTLCLSEELPIKPAEQEAPEEPVWGRTFAKYKAWTGKLDAYTKKFEAVCESKRALNSLKELNAAAVADCGGEASLEAELQQLIERLQKIRDSIAE